MFFLFFLYFIQTINRFSAICLSKQQNNNEMSKMLLSSVIELKFIDFNMI